MMVSDRIIELDDNDVHYLQQRDWRLARLIEHIGPLPVHKHETAFRSLTHSIIEQMLSMKAGRHIEEKLYSLCSDNLCPENILLLSVDEIRATGVSARKAASIHYLAEYAMTNDLERLSNLDDESICSILLDLPGIGRWTCEMFLLFYLERPDILPIDDSAFRQSFEWLYGAPVTALISQQIVCSLWRPYSSTAVRYLYRALNVGLVKELDANVLCCIDPGVKTVPN